MPSSWDQSDELRVRERQIQGKLSLRGVERVEVAVPSRPRMMRDEGADGWAAACRWMRALAREGGA